MQAKKVIIADVTGIEIYNQKNFTYAIYYARMDV